MRFLKFFVSPKNFVFDFSKKKNLISFFCLFQLQEAFARGDLKPGLNIEVGGGVKRKAVNNIVSCTTSSSNVHFISMRISISFIISFSRISAGFTTKIGRIQIEIAMD